MSRLNIVVIYGISKFCFRWKIMSTLREELIVFQEKPLKAPPIIHHPLSTIRHTTKTKSQIRHGWKRKRAGSSCQYQPSQYQHSQCQSTQPTGWDSLSTISGVFGRTWEEQSWGNEAKRDRGKDWPKRRGKGSLISQSVSLASALSSGFSTIDFNEIFVVVERDLHPAG